MSVTALKATTEATHLIETPAAVRTQENRRVKEAAHAETKVAVEPVRLPAATSSSGVRGALVSLKKGG